VYLPTCFPALAQALLTMLSTIKNGAHRRAWLHQVDSAYFLTLTGRVQFSIVTWRGRDTVSLPAGASLVSVVPAPRVAPLPTVTGATSWLSLPMKASSSMTVRDLLARRSCR